tara:strand:+ start:397 stop:705 length:309 start_codon:yes stop_codon:yes gene_type:complete
MMAKKVYTADSVSMAWHFRNVLEQHGISSVVKNDNLYSAGGELPLNECMPEVWVEHALYAEYAKEIIQLIENYEIEDEGEWICERCSEANFASFDICWNCSD